MPRYALLVNGRVREVDAAAEDSLLSLLRQDLGLTGSKYGCGEGHCGACTVLVDGHTARSCVTTVGRVAGQAITTIEGLATGDELHPVQQAFLEAEAFQCGYCTPGMIMGAVGLLNNSPTPSDEEIARAMDRNLCRCGTFPRIVRAIRTASARLHSAASAREQP